jgi:ankyrin repeat protein
MTDTLNTTQSKAADLALFDAVDHHNLLMAQALVKAGADLTVVDPKGKTAMQHAVDHADLAMVALLGEARREQERGQGPIQRNQDRGIERD